MIEKRRRDRINNSLNELRRLVPAAFEKQGSAKLEKAEILQMTVDHLTMLHAKGRQRDLHSLRSSPSYPGIRGARPCDFRCCFRDPRLHLHLRLPTDSSRVSRQIEVVREVVTK